MGKLTSAIQSPRGRPVVALLLAALVPVSIFVVFLSVTVVREEQALAQQTAASRAKEIQQRVDAEVTSDMRALAAVAQSTRGVAIERSTPTPERARLNAQLFPQWLGALIWTPDERQAVFSSFPNEGLPDIPAHWASAVEGQQAPVVGGVEVVDELPVALLHMRVPNDERGYIITLGIRPDIFQDIMVSELPEGAIGAVVDRNGNFLARSVDYENRIATPATQYVRDAVATGGEGVYRGRTYEGFENYTAYYTSPVTGWSTHVAISDALVDSPGSLFTFIAIAGGLTCLILTAGLVFLVVQDNRRRTQSELALQQMQRMESIASLTGGVAHDFNNLLTVIIGNLQKLARSEGDISAAEAKSAIENALTSSRRAANLTRSLLAYSRQQALEPHVIDVNGFLTDASDLVQRTLGENYKIRTTFDDAAGRVEIDESQLGSALLNLAVNARDAMPDGGVITFGSKNVVLEKGAADLMLEPGRYVRISVSDNGPGMPPDVAEKAFDPFFTTKDVGKGTGLGLSQVDGFVRQSGGAAELITSEGQGVTIHLFLPATDKQLSVLPGAANPDAVGGVRPLRILVVEDEPIILAFATDMLEQMGHKVTACADAAGALAALRQSSFDLLFSDIVLPGGMSGLDLVRQASAKHPDMKALLATGYAREQIEGDQQNLIVIQKPYDRDEIAGKLWELFGEAGQQPLPPGKVLIVEDEMLIRMLAVDTLVENGMETIEAVSGAEALKCLEAEGDGLSAVIVDLGLPDMPGPDLVAKIAGMRPDVPLLIASGARPDEGDVPAAARRAFLPKPYTPEDLVAALGDLLSDTDS